MSSRCWCREEEVVYRIVVFAVAAPIMGHTAESNGTVRSVPGEVNPMIPRDSSSRHFFVRSDYSWLESPFPLFQLGLAGTSSEAVLELFNPKHEFLFCNFHRHISRYKLRISIERSEKGDGRDV